MKAVILAGGFGTRLAEETGVRPKPLVEIGDHPILWHILRHYGRHGHNKFVIALGYKGPEASRMVSKVYEQGMDTETVIRAALKGSVS